MKHTLNTNQLAELVQFGFQAKTNPTRWVRNFIYKNQIPFHKKNGRIYLNEEQQNEFWKKVELLNIGALSQ